MRTGQEIIHLQVGGCGHNIGSALWKQIHQQHSITPEGQHLNPKHDQKIWTYYSQSSKGVYHPRTVLVDMDSRSSDSALADKYGGLLKLQNCIYGDGSAGANWAKGYYSAQATQLAYETMDSIRTQMEQCDMAQGFQITNSISKGTGSGFGCKLINQINDQYRGKLVMPMTVFPTDKIANQIIQPYNVGLAIWKMNNAYNTATIVLENQAIMNILAQEYKLKNIQYADINYVIARNLSNFTSTQRYSSTSNNLSYRKMFTNLFPFTTTNFLTIGGFYNSYKAQQEQLSPVQMVKHLVYGNKANLSNVKTMHGRYISCTAIFRGPFSQFECEQATLQAQNRSCSPFVQWIPNNMNYTLVKSEHKLALEQKNKKVNRQVTMLQVSTGLLGSIQRIHEKYSWMLKRSAYLHWYLSEGVERSELYQAKQNMESMIHQMKFHQDATAEEEYSEYQQK